MVSSSPKLWCLVLVNLRREPEADEQVSPSTPTQPLALRHLSVLELSRIPPDVIDLFTSTITASGPMHVYAHNTVASPANTLLPSALRFITSAAKLVVFGYDLGTGFFSIVSEPHKSLEVDWVYDMDDQPAYSISLRHSSDWKTLASWLAAVTLPPAELFVLGGPSPGSFKFPTELLKSFTSLTALHIAQFVEPGPILKSLAETQACHDLTKVTVLWPDTKAYRDDMVALVNRGLDAGAEGSPQLLKEICVPKDLVDILKGEPGGQDSTYSEA